MNVAACLLAGLSLAGSAGAFSLSGQLQVQGTTLPLVGATVSLPTRPGIAMSLTDAAGAFLLTDRNVGVRASRVQSVSVWREAGALVLQGLSEGTVELELRGLDGCLLLRRNLSGSRSALRVPVGPMAEGVQVLRVRQDGTVRQWRLLGVPGAGSSILSNRTVSGAAARVAGTDTLLVTMAGMSELRFALPAGAGEGVASLESALSLQPQVQGRMRFVPGGTVLMGDTTLPEARPRIRRTVKAFWMDTLLATRAELAALGVSQSVSDARPADLDWNQAVRYCNARSLKDGLVPAYRLTADSAYWNADEEASGYRLPTEAEWEHAARAGSTSPWFWGSDTAVATVGKYAMYTRSTRGDQVAVGTLLPNPLGLYDIVGNAGEWTEDFYGPYAADETQPVAQVDPSAAYPQSRVQRTWRGGSWFSNVDGLRSGARNHLTTGGGAYIGVRCVRSAQPVAASRPWSAYPATGGARCVPGGTVRMGDPLQDSALPVHERSVLGLWVDTAMVTVGEYFRTAGRMTGSDSARPCNVDWYAAVKYCNARSLRDGLQPAYALAGDSSLWTADPARNGWRLPSEAEWEYLNRAGSTTGWWWGNDSGVVIMSRSAWWSGNMVGDLQPTGRKLPNAFGLYDMAGNAHQWVDGLFAPYRADGEPGAAVSTSKTWPPVYEHILRGGAWYSPATFLRSGHRGHDVAQAGGYNSFRCVRTAEPDGLRPWKDFPVSGAQRRVPAGTVRMGDSTSTDAQPFQVRSVRALWVDTSTVTGQEFRGLTGLYAFSPDSSAPADLDWYRAVRYCNARSLKEGLQPCYTLSADSVAWAADTSKSGYRLPSEAEWEYLARAGANTTWWWGSDSNVNMASSFAWWGGNTRSNQQRGGLKRANGFGLYDMAGNARQWTEDLYGAYQADGSQPVPLLVSGVLHRVYRGGGWYSPADDLRSGRRRHDMGVASGYIGMRCVRRAD